MSTVSGFMSAAPSKAHLQPVAQHLHLNVCWITWAPKDQLMLGSGPNASPACVLAPMPPSTWLFRPKPWKLPLSKACWLYLLLPSPQPKLLTSRTWMPLAATHPPPVGILASGCLLLAAIGKHLNRGIPMTDIPQHFPLNSEDSPHFSPLALDGLAHKASCPLPSAQDLQLLWPFVCSLNIWLLTASHPLPILFLCL